MSVRYSHHLSPNTPVDVFTIVGKYERVLAVKRHKPKSGHVFRAVNARTYYLNILESSATGSRPRLEVQRRFVDLEAQPVHRDKAPHPGWLPLQTCLLQPYVQACSVISRVVCFIDRDMERISANYLAWIEQCAGSVEEPVKPTAVIVLFGAQPQKRREEVAFELFRRCTSTRERSALYGQSDRCFDRTEVLSDAKLTRRDAVVNWELLHAIHETSMLAGRCLSSDLGYYWREPTVHRLFGLSVRHFAQRADAGPFSIAHALTADLPCAVPALTHQQAFFVADKVPRARCSPAVTAALLGMYMAHHLLAHCPLLELENFRTAPATSAALFDSIFRRRYAHVEERLLERGTESDDGTSPAESAKAHMRTAIDKYLSVDVCITQTHMAALGEYRGFFAQQSRAQRLCAGCFFAYWDDLLPCRHGLCKACTHNQFPQWKHSARLQIKRCPVCRDDFAEPVEIKVQPPTAGGRILSLDGGGVKGVIELEILQEISVLVGAHLPLHELFDMAVGTSIGGIAALGLFVSRWDLDTCRAKLATSAAQVFPPRPSGARIRGRLETALRYVRYAACVALQHSLVSSGIIRSVHCQEFGRHGSMMSLEQVRGAPVKVAVTARSTRDSACSLITTYNRPPTQQPEHYKWLQQDDANLHVKTWEAAQCTSAVPFLFPAAQLQGDRFYDGALVCNNPTSIALQEARLFWGPTDAHSMVLSIGCGTAGVRQTARKGAVREGPIEVCARSLMESLSAAKQHNDLALRGHRFARLDPALDMDAVSLDDVSAIPKLQRSFHSMLLRSPAFVECLRSAAFEMISSTFYIEIEKALPLAFNHASKDYSVGAMIRPRIPASSLHHLYEHHHFPSLRFEINGRSFTFSMPKKVTVRVQSPDSPVEVKLSCRTNSEQISGSPTSVEALLRTQTKSYHRKGSSKRRPSRMAPRDQPAASDHGASCSLQRRRLSPQSGGSHHVRRRVQPTSMDPLTHSEQA